MRLSKVQNIVHINQYQQDYLSDLEFCQFCKMSAKDLLGEIEKLAEDIGHISLGSRPFFRKRLEKFYAAQNRPKDQSKSGKLRMIRSSSEDRLDSQKFESLSSDVRSLRQVSHSKRSRSLSPVVVHRKRRSWDKCQSLELEQ